MIKFQNIFHLGWFTFIISHFHSTINKINLELTEEGSKKSVLKHINAKGNGKYKHLNFKHINTKGQRVNIDTCTSI